MKYNAFISYRHSELDMFIAKKVHKGLETFKVPAAVAKKCGKKKIERVFRDQEELPIGSDLNDNISGALATSEWLLVICSPRTPESYWVKKEITSFIEMHDREHVLAILIEGEPNESFPEELLTDENGNPVEPLAADVRGKTKAEINKKFRTEIMRLAAPVLGCSFDDLRQRHRERRLKKAMATIAAAGIIVAGLGIGFGLYNAKMVREIQANYQEKQMNQSRFLAKTSEGLLKDGDKRVATLIALEALPGEGNERPYVAEAEYALTDALAVYDTGNKVSPFRLLKHDVVVSKMFFSDDGNYLTTILSDESYSVWNVPEGKEVYYHTGFFDENDRIVYSKYANVLDEKFFLVLDDSMYVYSFDDEELLCEEFGSTVKEAMVCYATSQIAVFTDKLLVYDGETMQKVKEIKLPDTITSPSKMNFSADGRYVAMDSFDLLGTNVSVAIVDLETSKVNVYELSNAVCTKLLLDNNGSLFGLSYTNNALFGQGTGPVTISVDKFSFGATEADWTFNTEMDTTTFIDSYLFMSTVYDSNQNYDPVFSAGPRVYTLNGKTGELISQISTSSQVRALLTNASSRLAFVAEKDGKINFLNVDTGTFYTDAAIDTDTTISDVLLRNSHLVIRQTFSPDIMVYTYQSGAGMKEILAAEENIGVVFANDDESVYCVRSGYASDGITYDFYKSEDDSFIGSFTVSGNSVAKEFFIGNKFYAFASNGEITVFDTDRNEESVIALDVDFSIRQISLSQNKKFAVAQNLDGVEIVNLEEGKHVKTILQKANVYCSVISNDGKTVYYVDGDGLSKYNVETDKAETGLFENSDMSKSNNNSEDCLVFDEKNGHIAVACIDSYARVYEVKSGKCICEVPFNTFVRAFVGFSSDGRYLYLQGDDFYFDIYDIENDQYGYVSAEQINKISSIHETADGTEILLLTSEDMYTMRLEDLGIKNHIPGGNFYLKNYNKVLVSYHKTLYSFPYSSVEELIELANKTYADEPLDDFEKIKYNVE